MGPSPSPALAFILCQFMLLLEDTWRRKTSPHKTRSGLGQSYATFSSAHSKGNDSSISLKRCQLQEAKQQHSPNLRVTSDLMSAWVPKQVLLQMKISWLPAPI